MNVIMTYGGAKSIDAASSLASLEQGWLSNVQHACEVVSGHAGSRTQAHCIYTAVTS